MEGREVVIVEAVRTPVGRGHPEKGYYKDVHPNALLGTTFVELFDYNCGFCKRAMTDMLDLLKADPKLKSMMLVRSARLSVQPVTDAEWTYICKLGGVKA